VRRKSRREEEKSKGGGKVEGRRKSRREEEKSKGWRRKVRGEEKSRTLNQPTDRPMAQYAWPWARRSAPLSDSYLGSLKLVLLN